MKVLMISGDVSSINGEKGPFYYTLNGLGQYWSQIDVLCPGSKSPEYQLKNHIKLIPAKTFKILEPLNILIKGLFLNKHNNYDLIVSHDYGLMFNGISSALLSIFTRTPYVSEIHHIEGHPIPSNFKDRIYLFLGKLYIKTIAKIARGIRVDNSGMIDFLKSLGQPSEKIFLIYPMYIDLDVFKPTGEEKTYDIIYCGRLASNKGIFQILELIKHIKKSRSQVKLIIKGHGPLEDEINSYITKNKLYNNVDLIKWVDTDQDLSNLYNKAKILICASTAEGGPRVTIEAMACGVPVISTPVGIMPEVVKNGENGYLYKWEIEELSRRTEEILNLNKDDYEKMSIHARNSVKIFQKDKALAFYAQTYHSIVTEK